MPAKVCACCGGKQAPLKLCSACRSVRYCSAACQRSHWQAHKAACKAVRLVGEEWLPLSSETQDNWYNCIYAGLRAGESRKTLDMLMDQFLDLGGDINMALSLNGWTLLHSVTDDDNVPAIRFLVARGADVNTRTQQGQVPGLGCSGSSPLHLAAIFGNVASIIALLDLGAAVEQRNLMGETPLLAASWDVPVLEAFVSRGADIHASVLLEEGAANLLDWHIHCASHAKPLPTDKVRAVVEWCHAHGIRETLPQSSAKLRMLLSTGTSLR